VEDPIVTKDRLVRDIADRCLAGNFGGIAYRAAKEPECVEFGISYQLIQYHMDQKHPLAAADRAADRARARRLFHGTIQQSLTRLNVALEKRLATIEAKRLATIEAKPISSTMTWDEEEVLEMEGVIAELTAQLQELKGEAKANVREFDRNRGMVANMGPKYAELAELKDRVRELTAKIGSLEADLAVARANPLPGFAVPLYSICRDVSKRGAPYPEHFENVSAPAMLNTGATPEQINEIIRIDEVRKAM